MVYRLSVKIVLWLLQMSSEVIFLPVHIFRLFEKPTKCPPIKDDILLWSAEKLAERIRKKQITSVAVVKAYISRINEVNPIINAVIENRFEDAIKDAKKVDTFLQHSKLSENKIKEKYPLLGVPVTIKGSLAVTGMLCSAGSLAHTIRAESDAPAVKHIRDAGAIPLLISNVPELCLNWETTNKLIGTTANPYNTTRTSGGSSGGEASLIASGASVIGLGSDLAGSLRVPAHYCGIWSHKPSPQVVSSLGHYPECKNNDEWKRHFAIGPLTRYATDLKFVLNVIAEPSEKQILKLNQKVDLKTIKVYYIKNLNSPISHSPSKDVSEAIEKVVKHFNTFCENKCIEVDEPYMQYCGEFSNLRITLMEMDIDNFFDGKDAKVYYELVKFFSGQSNHVFGSLGYGVIKHLVMNFLPEDTINIMYNYFDTLQKKFLKMLGDDGVLIVPASPSEAVHHNDVKRRPFDYGFCAIFNVLGFPSTTCPVEFSANGLPIGIQVVSAPYSDRLTLAVGEELERKFGGWKFH